MRISDWSSDVCSSDLDGRFEVDQFDDEYARYVILSEPDGTHLASARLLPTLRPHILDSFYARLCDAPPPRGEDVFEITRFCLDRNLRAAERRGVRNRLVTAIRPAERRVGEECGSPCRSRWS